MSCRRKDLFPLNFQIVKNNALTLTSDSDPIPWSLPNITNTSGLVGFRSVILDCFKLMMEMTLY